MICSSYERIAVEKPSSRHPCTEFTWRSWECLVLWGFQPCSLGLPRRVLVLENMAANARLKRWGFDPGSGHPEGGHGTYSRILPGESHEQRSWQATVHVGSKESTRLKWLISMALGMHLPLKVISTGKLWRPHSLSYCWEDGWAQGPCSSGPVGCVYPSHHCLFSAQGRERSKVWIAACCSCPHSFLSHHAVSCLLITIFSHQFQFLTLLLALFVKGSEVSGRKQKCQP